MEPVLSKDCSKLETQKQTASKHLKKIKKHIKGLNLCDFVKIIKTLSKNHLF